MPTKSQDLMTTASVLLAELFLALDARDYQALASCFASDAVWHRQGRELAGAANIVQTLEDTRPRSLVTVHCVNNVAVRRETATTGHARFYLTVFRHDDGKLPTGPVPVPKPAVVGMSTAEFAREKGKWLVRTLKTGPYAFSG